MGAGPGWLGAATACLQTTQHTLHLQFTVYNVNSLQCKQWTVVRTQSLSKVAIRKQQTARSLLGPSGFFWSSDVCNWMVEGHSCYYPETILQPSCNHPETILQLSAFFLGLVCNLEINLYLRSCQFNLFGNAPLGIFSWANS